MLYLPSKVHDANLLSIKNPRKELGSSGGEGGIASASRRTSTFSARSIALQASYWLCALHSPNQGVISQHLFSQKKRTKASLVSFFWRRGWDSNPRYRYRHDSFQDCSLQPLGHLSSSSNCYNLQVKVNAIPFSVFAIVLLSIKQTVTWFV